MQHFAFVLGDGEGVLEIGYLGGFLVGHGLELLDSQLEFGELLLEENQGGVVLVVDL